MLKNKKDFDDVYCITLIEIQAHRDVLIQLVGLLVLLIKRGYKCLELKVLHNLTVRLYSCLSYSTCKENAPITLSPVARTVLPLFSTLSYKRHEFLEKKNVANLKFVF